MTAPSCFSVTLLLTDPATYSIPFQRTKLTQSIRLPPPAADRGQLDEDCGGLGGVVHDVTVSAKPTTRTEPTRRLIPTP